MASEEQLAAVDEGLVLLRLMAQAVGLDVEMRRDHYDTGPISVSMVATPGLGLRAMAAAQAELEDKH